MPARDLQLLRQPPEVDIGSDRRFPRKHLLPDPEPVLLVGKREMDDEAQTANERLIQVLLEIRRQDDDATVLLDPLQQVAVSMFE